MLSLSSPLQLSGRAEIDEGVIGNHALAVAFSARTLRIPSIVVLPLATPEGLCQRLSRLYSTVILHGKDIDGAKEECLRLQRVHKLIYIATHGDPLLLAGHGTMGSEILKQIDLHRLTAIICPVDSGTLIAGLGVYVKHVAPNVEIIGVEHVDDLGLSQLLYHRRKSSLQGQMATSRIDEETVRICAEVVDDVVQVGTDEIFRAIREAYEDTLHILEPTGAISVAGLAKWATSKDLDGSEINVIAIISEANIDFLALPGIVQQAFLAM